MIKIVEGKEYTDIVIGEAQTFQRSNGTLGLIYVCPLCGTVKELEAMRERLEKAETRFGENCTYPKCGCLPNNYKCQH
jgi:hypothetical protein